MVTVLPLLLSIAFAPSALGRTIRLYSIATVAVLLLFGSLTGFAGSLLWVAALAAGLLRRSSGSSL
jgi:hypothetical protein